MQPNSKVTDKVRSAFAEIKIISATQDGVVRLHESTEESVKGLYTGGLKPCVGVIIVSKPKEGKCRISLSHVDATVDLNALEAEFNFVKDFNAIFKIAVVMGAHRKESNKLSENICKKFKSTILECLRNGGQFPRIFSDNEIAFVDRNGEIKKFSESGYQLLQIKSVPMENIRHAINMLNHSFDEDLSCRGLDIQYDGLAWTGLPQLSAWIASFIESVKGKMNPDKHKGYTSDMLIDKRFLRAHCEKTVDIYRGKGELDSEVSKEAQIDRLASHLAGYIAPCLNYLPNITMPAISKSVGENPHTFLPSPKQPSSPSTQLSMLLPSSSEPEKIASDTATKKYDVQPGQGGPNP